MWEKKLNQRWATRIFFKRWTGQEGSSQEKIQLFNFEHIKHETPMSDF